MAIATGAGAEVQQPIATVVIGGLVTATLRTVMVLPALYAGFGSANPAPPEDAGPEVSPQPRKSERGCNFEPMPAK